MPNTRTTIRTEITEWVVKVQKKLLVIGAEHQDARADLAVSELLEGQTRSGVQKLMLAGAVLCGGRPLSKNDRVAEGQTIEVLLPDPAPMEQAEPENIPLDIVYEDDDLLWFIPRRATATKRLSTRCCTIAAIPCPESMGSSAPALCTVLIKIPAAF